MKKKKLLVVILTVLILLSSGCTKYLSDGNKKRITNETTGQAITSNILCLPESEELLNIYKDNKDRLAVDYESLKNCKEFTPSDVKYAGLWETIFVKPLAWILIKVGLFVNNYGLSVMIIGIIIRLILMPFTAKSLKQSQNMRKAQPELQRIQKKYENSKDNQAQAMAMSQEMMAVYKKYNVNPASGCIIAFIQLPILLAFLEAINRVPAIFEGSFLSLQLGTNPSVGIRNGNYLYIVLILLIIVTTYFSYKNSMSASSGNVEQDKQMGMMMKFMIIFISIASLSLPTALALYWIVSNGFMMIQNFLIKRSLDENYSSKREKNVKEAKFKELNKKGK